MNVERGTYESIAKEKAWRLAEMVSHPVTHGGEGFCPRCSHAGLYDLQGFGVSGESIFYSTADEKWRCMSCEIGALGC